MFSQDQQRTVEVIVRATDGIELEGKLVCGLSGLIEAVLNNDSQFIEIINEDGETTFLSKSHIIKLLPKKSKTQTLPKLKVNDNIGGNWAEILGVGFDASSQEVKQAYHDLAKSYHPDLFSIDMPLEVKEYASKMLSRINVAYEQYKSFKKAA